MSSPRAKIILKEGLKEMKEKKFLDEAAVGSEYSRFVLERLKRKKLQEEEKRDLDVKKLSL